MARKEKVIYAIDSETDPFKYGRTPEPFCWGIWGADDYADFWGDDCTEQFIEWCQDLDNVILYAHNGGKFDFFFLLKYLDPEMLIINGRISKATMFGGRVELRDSYLILPQPLKSHGKIDIEYSKMERGVRNKHKREILNYLREDCRSLYDWVKNFRDNFGGGLTLAGSAFNQLKLTEYPMENTNEFFDATFRAFYYGGRVQCLQVGKFEGDYKYIDINSAYPYAMKFKHWQGSAYREVLRLPQSENGSWYATIEAVSKGALPFRGENGRLYFPDDDIARVYQVTGWEINAGLRTNTLTIKKIIKCYVPSFTADFSEYVDKFFKMKLDAEKANDKTARQFAKLMLNSCYGKFGQDGRQFKKFMLCEWGDVPEPFIGKDGEPVNWDLYGDTETLHSFFYRPDPSHTFYNVATAASVTGFVRAYLWEAICNSETPLYCDTDSLICKTFNGAIGDQLGEWDLEANIKEAYIAQRKMYALLTDKGEHKIASKGVRLNFEQIKTGVLSGQNIVTERDAPAFSLRFGTRFTKRNTDFKNVSKNACNNPPLV